MQRVCGGWEAGISKTAWAKAVRVEQNSTFKALKLICYGLKVGHKEN